MTPSGESLLIDSGYPDNKGRDRDRILKVAKEVAGLKQIDNAAVTHWHLDHFGNHAALSSLIPIKTFWDRGIPDTLAEDDKVRGAEEWELSVRSRPKSVEKARCGRPHCYEVQRPRR